MSSIPNSTVVLLSFIVLAKISPKTLTPQFLVPKSYVGMTPKIKPKVLFSTPMLALQTEYEIKVYLFVCWKLYSILRTFIPGPKNLSANKLCSLFAATMLWSGFGPYHGMWLEYAQTKFIGVIPTPWAMTIALGLGVIMPELELYHAYGRAILRNFYFMS